MTYAFAAFSFATLMILSGVADMLARRIPNRLTLSIALLFFPAALMTGMPPLVIGLHAGAGLLVLAGGYILFSLRLIGGGDAKLLAAAALWLGFQGLPMFLMMTVLTGGLLSLAVLAWSMVSMHYEIEDATLSRYLKVVRPSVPYGYAIAAGAIIAFPESWWSGVA